MATVRLQTNLAKIRLRAASIQRTRPSDRDLARARSLTVWPPSPPHPSPLCFLSRSSSTSPNHYQILECQNRSHHI
eukprot:5882842-Pyramimonas_sp.AAC.1